MNCSFQAVYLFDQVVEVLCNAEVKFIAVERIKEISEYSSGGRVFLYIYI